jgi:sugar O-acyltransferase (sialic acid O-acetyltransferase NeuD family)
MEKIYAVYGASGFGREVAPILKSRYPSSKIIFVDDNANISESLNGYQVLTYKNFLNISEPKAITIAIADSKIRQMITQKVLKDGIELVSVTASNSIFLDNNTIGDGSIFCPFTMVTSNVRVGLSFQANIYSYIAHDCVIGDYVTFAPSVKCNGNVHIHDHAYIGAGAVIKQGLPGTPLVIGKGAVIGMGAVVTKSIEPGLIVIGNPARTLK